MKNITLLLFIIFLQGLPSYSQSTLESIPNQKLIDNSYVSNPDNILDENTVAHINSILTDVENETTVQVAVVAVSSIGEEDIFEFAHALFNTWGIGNSQNDNGLLLLLVEDKHTIRFHTGLGIESVLPDAVCKRIQRDYMVPAFEKGDYNAGLLQGVYQVKQVLTDPAYAEELKKPEAEAVGDYASFVIFMVVFIGPVFLMLYIIKAVNKKFSNSRTPAATPYKEMQQKGWEWALLYGGIPLIILLLFGLMDSTDAAVFAVITLYLYFIAMLFHKLWREKKVINRFLKKQDYYQITEFLRKSQTYWFFMALFFPIPFALYFFYHLARKRMYRNHSRQCKLCNATMNKLNEIADDQYLSKARQMEEMLRSVDYDVWQCEACAATEEWNYPRRTSKYKECPSCKTHAYYLVSRRTVQYATYTSSGRGEEIHTCKFCSKSKTKTYTIARLTRSSSSSSSGSSGTSGGSWGGGRSGGGGASSSW